jgi:hypothetical protein
MIFVGTQKLEVLVDEQEAGFYEREPSNSFGYPSEDCSGPAFLILSASQDSSAWLSQPFLYEGDTVYFATDAGTPMDIRSARNPQSPDPTCHRVFSTPLTVGASLASITFTPPFHVEAR